MIDDRRVDDPPVGGGTGRQRDGDTPGRWEPPKVPSDRERLAENVADRLDVPMSVLGVVFVLVVLAETTADPSGALGAALEVLGWLLWGAFALEFVVRLVVAPSTGAFLRRNWWQVVFLAVPFLRFLRVLRVVRVGRVARLVRIASSAVRSTRSARRALSGRIAWLAATTIVVVLSASQVLYLLEVFDRYGEALHAVALATVAGEPIGAEAGAAQVAEVVLAIYSVVVFASLAGAVGAYFLEQGRSPVRRTRDNPEAAA